MNLGMSPRSLVTTTLDGGGGLCRRHVYLAAVTAMIILMILDLDMDQNNMIV